MQTITYEEACKISDYLLKKNMGFCFLPNGQMITKEQCEEVINNYNTLK